MPGEVWFAGKPHGWAAGRRGALLHGAAAQQDPVTMSLHCAFLLRRHTWELGSSRCREGDGDCAASAGSAAAAPFATASGGSPGTGWWSYSLFLQPL